MSKLCKDCAHLKLAGNLGLILSGRHHWCMALGETSPVTGERLFTSCQRMRSTEGECGPEGRLFKQAETDTETAE